MSREIRILHVVGGMRQAGTETWLINVLRLIDRDRFQMDFLTHSTDPTHYDDEIRSLGGRIIPCLSPNSPGSYSKNFARVMSDFGPYDIVHSHMHHFSGLALWLAARHDVPVRVAHSHLDTRSTDAQASIPRKFYTNIAAKAIQRSATQGLAASEPAAESLFGRDWKNDQRWRILHCGVDLQPFTAAADRAQVRNELGIPSNAFVIGHVGRFELQKNHAFLIDVIKESSRANPLVWGLLVGDGMLRSEIEAMAAQAGIGDRVVFAGVRADVPRVMLGAMDAFAFPSAFEGLGLAIVEAQAAGLPCVISNVVPREADVIGGLVRRLGLSDSSQAWAEAVLSAKRVVSQEDALRTVEMSDFNVITSTQALCEFYSEAVTNRRVQLVNRAQIGKS